MASQRVGCSKESRYDLQVAAPAPDTSAQRSAAGAARRSTVLQLVSLAAATLSEWSKVLIDPLPTIRSQYSARRDRHNPQFYKGPQTHPTPNTH